jgi:hypothetical protein
VGKLHGATIAILESSPVKARMAEIGADMTPPERRSPQYLQRFIENEIEKWAAPIKASGAAIEN